MLKTTAAITCVSEGHGGVTIGAYGEFSYRKCSSRCETNAITERGLSAMKLTIIEKFIEFVRSAVVLVLAVALAGGTPALTPCILKGMS